MKLLTVLVAVLLFSKAHAQQRLIYDDDCSNDVDCVVTLPILHTLQDRGEIKILAMLADSANPLTAPTLRLFALHAHHRQIQIGANQTSLPDNPICEKEACNKSLWADKLVARFDPVPGDTRANYPDCVTVYRKALAPQPAHSVAIVATGFATCLNQLLASVPDTISPLSGVDLVRRKVKLLSIMGGRYPSGIEWNFECDAPGYHKLFTQWTRQNGFPPLYLNGFTNGEHVLDGEHVNASPLANPTRYALELAHTDQRPMWDMLSALFAARGLAHNGTPYFTQSGPGTVTVSPTDGADTWSPATDSGHYVLTNAASDETLSALFDGFAHHGLLAEPANSGHSR